MADVTVVKSKVAPMYGAIVRQHSAGGVVNVGDSVYQNGTGDQVEQTKGNAVATALAIGVVTSIGTEGGTVSVAGDALGVVVFGPVSGFSGLTPAALGYVSDNAGAIGTAAGSKSKVIGRNESDEVFFVNPTLVAAA